MSQFVSLFGDALKVSQGTVSTAEALSNKVVAVYFSAHWCPPCRGFTPQLADWYTSNLAAKGLEVVFVSSDQDEDAFNEYFGSMPWKALPYNEREKKAALSKKFKVRGIPTLVILDEHCNVITLDGRSAVSQDPTGDHFPWHPKSFKQLLGTTFVGQGGDALDVDAVDGQFLGLYFSAHWCPPCRKFTPELAAWYKKVASKLPNFKIVFVSSDKSQADFDEYFAEMPWIALPYADRKRKEELSDFFSVQGIPTLVIVDADGNVITTNGRGIPSMDPEGTQFPWHPKPVKDLAHNVDGIQENPSLVVFMDGVNDNLCSLASDAVLTVAEEYKMQAKTSGEDQKVLFFTGGSSAQDILRRIRSLTKQPIVPVKHEHPLQEKADRQNWACDGCGESGEGVAFSCEACNFDFCKECNSNAVDNTSQVLSGVLLDLPEDSYYVCDGVDFTSSSSIREYLQKYTAGSLLKMEL